MVEGRDSINNVARRNGKMMERRRTTNRFVCDSKGNNQQIRVAQRKHGGSITHNYRDRNLALILNSCLALYFCGVFPITVIESPAP